MTNKSVIEELTARQEIVLTIIFGFIVGLMIAIILLLVLGY